MKRLISVLFSVFLSGVLLAPNALAQTSSSDAKAKKTAKTSKSVKLEDYYKQYPQSAYISGVAAADDINTAQDRARAEITKVFTVKIESVVSSHESEALVNGKTEAMQKVAVDVKATSDKIMEGIKIVDTWKNEEEKRYYSFAALDKKQAISLMQNKLRDLDMSMSMYEGSFMTASTAFERAKNAAKILFIMDARETMLTDLKILGGSAMPNDGELKAQCQAAMAALVIYVNVSGDSSDIIGVSVNQSLRNMTFTVIEDSAKKSDISVKVKASLSTGQVNVSGRSMHQAKCEGMVKVNDVAGGKEIYGGNEYMRKFSQDYDESVRRCAYSLGEQIAENIQLAINEYFRNN